MGANAGVSLEPENTKKIAEAILKICRLPQRERNRLGGNGRKSVGEHHPYKKLAQKYDCLFE